MSDSILTADVEFVRSGSRDPFQEGRSWAHSEWAVTLHYDGRTMALPFYTGTAHDKPTAGDVLECLLSDASGAENARDYEEWASEYGYDTDSIRERARYERTYNAVVEQTNELRELLGEAFDSAVFPPDYDSEAAARRLTGDA